MQIREVDDKNLIIFENLIQHTMSNSQIELAYNFVENTGVNVF